MNEPRPLKTPQPVRLVLGVCVLFGMASLWDASAGDESAGFSIDCDNTQGSPCRRLVASEDGKPVKIESSSAWWSETHGKVFVVSDNFNDLVEQGAGHYVIGYFDPDVSGGQLVVQPLLTPEQVDAFKLYDLEGVTLIGDRLFAIGSLALHGKDPERDRWERHQFLRMDVVSDGDTLRAANLAHVSDRWPNFRDWLISKSGYEWTGEAVRGRAEGEGINVEALSATIEGNLLVGLRGPEAPSGGTLALEIELPATPDGVPRLVREHVLPVVSGHGIDDDAPKTLRAITLRPDRPGQYYVVLGPKGYERERLVLAIWDSVGGQLSGTTLLPVDFVAEGVTPIPGGRVLVVDDLDERILIAEENGR